MLNEMGTVLMKIGNKMFCILRSLLLLDLGKKENTKVLLSYVCGGQQTKKVEHEPDSL